MLQKSQLTVRCVCGAGGALSARWHMATMGFLYPSLTHGSLLQLLGRIRYQPCRARPWFPFSTFIWSPNLEHTPNCPGPNSCPGPVDPVLSRENCHHSASCSQRLLKGRHQIEIYTIQGAGDHNRRSVRIWGGYCGRADRCNSGQEERIWGSNTCEYWFWWRRHRAGTECCHHHYHRY